MEKKEDRQTLHNERVQIKRMQGRRIVEPRGIYVAWVIAKKPQMEISCVLQLTPINEISLHGKNPMKYAFGKIFPIRKYLFYQENLRSILHY